MLGASSKSAQTPAPRLRPAGGALADLREGLSAVQAPKEKTSPVARHTQQKAAGSGYPDANANSPPCPPHDSARRKKHPATSARGYVRCKRQQHPPCPAHPVNSHRECLVPCRTVAIPPMPATPNKKPLGVATRMPLAQKDNRRAALYSLPAPPHDSAQQDELPPCCPPRGAMSSATPQETTCPDPPHTPKGDSGCGGADAICSERQQHVSGGLSPLNLDKQPSR